MAWWDHEELKNPEHRSTKYKFTFENLYTQDELRKEWDSLNETERAELVSITPTFLLNLKQKIMHSGGAQGADAIFGACARAVGHRVIHHSFEDHSNRVPKSEVLTHTQHDLEEATLATVLAAQILQRSLGKDQYVKKLLLRNSLIVEKAQVLFAVGRIEDKEILGGTAWGVAVACEASIPSYVFDMNTNQWFYYIIDDWGRYKRLMGSPANENAVMLGNERNYAGIGSRDMTEEGISAIKRLYVRYLNEK